MDFCRICFASEHQDCKLDWKTGDCNWSAMTSDEYAKQLTDQLLLCPFCGGKPNEDVFFCGVINSNYYVKCMNCSVVMNHDRTDKVIGMWNNRGGKK